MQGVKQIMDVLAHGGVFCTYPDFVYRGRGALPYAMFGRPRSMASAMLSIAMKTRAVLLPAQCRLTVDQISIEVDEPLAIDAGVKGAEGLRFLTDAVGGILEQQISANPSAWLLLNSLVAASPQMAQSK
nr:hypothetical protein [Luteimonas sp. RC10]